MTKIIIERTSESSYKARNIELFLNGEKIGEIADGETKEFTIEPGEYELRAKIERVGSEDYKFEAIEDEVKNFQLSGFKYSKWLIPAAIGIYVVLRFFFHVGPIYMLIIIVPPVLILIYFMTIGRNKYLKISEVE